MSFTEAGGRREQFAAVQQLDFSGFTTTVDTLTNVKKYMRSSKTDTAPSREYLTP